jgi:hypothetical protein
MNRTLALLLLAALGCSSTPAAAVDAGSDLGRDAGSDALDDIGRDAGSDVGHDLGPGAPDVVRPDGASVVTLDDVMARVFRPHCAVPSCHASSDPTGRMRLDEDFPRTSLRDVAAMGVSCSGQGLVRVVPGDPSRSLLYLKLTEDPPPCGSRMPQAADPLPDELIALVREWIAAGAP